MSSLEENKALVRRFYEEIDKGNIDAMDELVAEDYINHDPPPFPGLATGRAGLKQAFEMFWKATPGRHIIEDQVAEGDKVVTRLRAVGKHEGELAGIPPSGNDLDVKAVAIHRIENGKLAEHWSVVDSAALLSQLGVIQLPFAPKHGNGAT
ncbi:MAG: ester cyclase [Armatimonadota bacterium]|nr:ester cyclase [Armatimonadota bacterium]MDR7440257.1 ester cyclase [Armatimonadota bacterium]MDR7444584.1 ester cyclase [Armatimonadota bacterium]MDR7570250.1 ester cyclase [Armatimonadota bacterium]MDR7615554.1 ester cyclase [Armatimonadota bacterium]